MLLSRRMDFPVSSAVLAAFPIGKVSLVEPITAGLIHATYKVTAEQGKFILQKLHPVLSSDAIAEDFLAVTSFLNEKGFPAARCIPTVAGPVLFRDETGTPWRLQTFLSGGKTFHTVETPAMAAEAGSLYARFHAVMAVFPGTLKTERVGHDTPKILAAFQETVAKFAQDPLMEEVKEDVALILAELPKLLLPVGLPLRAIHGDPKVSNILFDQTGKAMALVDLDTCNQRPLAVELGDAFRSWCGLEEDRVDNRFRADIFAAGWKAYRVSAPFLTPEEIAAVGQGIGLITLELAARFLADYFTDSYFGWDTKRYPSRRAHNLARARGQLALYKDFVAQRAAVEAILAC